MSTIELNGRKFVADLSMYSRQPLESSIQLQDSGAEPSERSLSRFGWKRSSTDFVFGAGQEWFDQEDDNIRRRYYESVGLDFTQRGRLKTVQAPTQRTTSTTTAGSQLLVAGAGTSGVGWWVNGTQISKLTSRGATRTLGSNLPGGNITGCVALNGRIYIADGTGLYYSTEAANNFTNQLGSLTPDILLVAAGRLLGMEGGDLYEIDTDGTKLGGDGSGNIFSHPSTSFTWKGGVNAPNGVYLYGDDGRNVDLFLLVPTDATGEFAAPFPATAWPQGEIINAVEQFGGVLAFATNRGLRLATIGGSGFVTYGPVLDDLGPIFCLANDGEFLYGGFSASFFEGTEYTGLALFNLGRFTETLVPSYAPFLVSSLGAGSTVDAACIVLESSNNVLTPVPIFAADGATSTDRELWSPSSSEIESPIIIRLGKVTYGTPEDKTIMSFECVLTGIASDDTVTASVVVDDETYTLDVSNVGSLFRFVTQEPVTGWSFDLTITITLGTAGSHADIDVERWTMRSLVKPEMVKATSVGITLDTEVRDGNRRQHSDPFADWNFINDLDVSKEIVELKIGDLVETGYVDGFIAAEGQIKDEYATGETGTFVQGSWILRFVSSPDAVA